MDKDKLYDIVSIYYDNEKDILKKKIREKLKENSTSTFDNLSIENMIFEIFSDKEFAINKIVRDIINYQNNKITSIDTEYNGDLGLKVDINELGVCISSILINKKEFNIINTGDYIIEINGIDLQSLSTEKQIETLQNLKHMNTTNLTLVIYNN
jgi:hypothetical protein